MPQSQGNPSYQPGLIFPCFSPVIFSGLAVFLFLPFRQMGNLKECLTQFNSILAAGGCFCEPRRWLASFNIGTRRGCV